MGQREKWGGKSEAREKWGKEKSEARNVRCDKSGEKRKVGREKLGIDKIGTRKVGQREKYSEKSTRRKVRLEKWVTKWGVKSEPRKVG